MLFFMTWEKHMSLLVDVADEDAARELGGKIAEGRAPSKVTALPLGFFVAECSIDEDEEDEDEDEDEDEGETFLVEPLKHVCDVLRRLELGEALTAPAPAQCAAEAYDDADRVVRCSLAANHAGEHRAGVNVWGPAR